MKEKKILVTGAAGFIGSHLVDELLNCGHSVVGLDNLRNGTLDNISTALKNSQFRFVQGDIRKPEDIERSMDGIDVVFHLACMGVRHSLHSPVENHEVNATGTLNVLKTAQEASTAQFFYISTSEIYGKTKDFPISESAATLPVTVYGSSKLVGEHYAHSFRETYGLPTTVLRIFNNYGPRAHYEGDCGEIIPRSILKILQNESPVIFGDGSVTRDFIFVKDTVKALSSLVGRNDLVGETFNIGYGSEFTMKTLLETLLAVIGNSRVNIRYAEERPADVPRLWVNTTKFHKKTGFTASTSLEEGLRKTVPYYANLLESGKITEFPERNWEVGKSSK